MKKCSYLQICVLTVSMLFFTNHLSAQLVVGDVTGKTWQSKSAYSEVSGSPFLSDKWGKGTVKFAINEGESKPIDLKYDQIADVVLFKNEKEETLEFVDPVVAFKIDFVGKGVAGPKTFRNGFSAVNQNTNKSYYEILADGNVIFAKKSIKTIMEESSYNSSAIAKTIIEKPYYYIIKDNIPVVVSKNEKAILSAIGTRTAELGDYIKQNKLNLKNDEDIVKLVTYFNSLPKV